MRPWLDGAHGVGSMHAHTCIEQMVRGSAATGGRGGWRPLAAEVDRGVGPYLLHHLPTHPSPNRPAS